MAHEFVNHIIHIFDQSNLQQILEKANLISPNKEHSSLGNPIVKEACSHYHDVLAYYLQTEKKQGRAPLQKVGNW